MSQTVASGVWTRLNGYDSLEVLHQHGSNVTFTITGNEIETEPVGVEWEYRAGPIGYGAIGQHAEFKRTDL